MKRWTQPDIFNSTRDLLISISGAMEFHTKATQRVMTYCVDTAEQRILLKTDGIWYGSKDFKLQIKVISEPGYEKDKTRQSVNAWYDLLCGS